MGQSEIEAHSHFEVGKVVEKREHKEGNGEICSDIPNEELASYGPKVLMGIQSIVGQGPKPTWAK